MELALNILQGYALKSAYTRMCDTIIDYYTDQAEEEIDVFHRILNTDMSELKEADIKSSGYVVDTLEASIWCILTSKSYYETVLKAVNLGVDTDTTAAVAGGLAGIIYGLESIPKEWIDIIARKDDILDLCERFSGSIQGVN